MSGPQRMVRSCSSPKMMTISGGSKLKPLPPRVYRFRKVSADPNAPLGGCKWRGNLPIPAHAHWAVRTLVRRLNSEQTTMTEACKRAGIARTSIWRWANEYHPRIDEIEAALNAVGLRLSVVEMEEE